MTWRSIRTTHYIGCMPHIQCSELTRNGENLDVEYTDQFCGIPISACQNRIAVMLYNRRGTNNLANYLNYFYSSLDNLAYFQTKYFLCLTRSKLRKMFAAVSRHCKFGFHDFRLSNDYCRNYHNIDIEESTLYIL